VSRSEWQHAARRAAWALLLGLPAIPGQVAAQSSQPLDAFWTANGTTETILPVGATVYIGGSFTLVGPPTGSTARFGESGGGTPDPGFPKADGVVYAVAPDGAGGWYFGGAFTRVGGLARTNAAHILSDGRVSAWNPSPDGEVRALAVAGPVVYAGGYFTSIGGQPRNRIAALDAATGVARPWNPNANLGVVALAVAGDLVYAGGDFTSIGGQARNRIAALDAATGLATPWNPNPNNFIYTLAVSGDRVYVGGAFTSVGGQSRSRIAALSAASGLATSWNPNATGGFQSVLTLAAVDDVVYAGGRFTIIGGQTRNYVAEVDATTGLATSWNPNANDWVDVLAVSPTRVYVGGPFTTIGGQPRFRFAAIERSDGSPSSWDPRADGQAYALAASGGRLFAGGVFHMAQGIVRNRAAALDTATGMPTAWDPDVTPLFSNSPVRALSEAGGTIYLGGDFSAIGGQPRSLIGSVDASLGAVTSWNPNASPSTTSGVLALAATPAVVYAGGRFDNIGGQTRNRIAALDVSTGLATAWDPNAGPNRVNTLGAPPGSVYAGGDFSGIGGQTRRNIAEVDPVSGVPTSWDPGTVSFEVRSLAVTPGEVYLGGTFTTMAGQPRDRIAAVDRATGLATAFDPGASGTVAQVAVQGSLALAAGNFFTFGGQSRTHMAAADRVTGVATSWAPIVRSGGAAAVAADAKRVYGGGDFPRGSFVAFCLATPPGGLTATPAGSNQIDLAWTANGAPGYRVLRARTPGGPYEDLGTTAAASFSDTTAQGGVTYYYVVRSIDECESDLSAEVSATAVGACALPPDFEGAAWVQQPPADTCSLAVGWGDASAPCGGPVTYSVYRDTSPIFLPSPANRIAGGLAGTSFVDASALPPGVAQYYVVRALSTVTGLEEANEIRQSAAPTACAGAASDGVRVLAARATNGQVKLEWVNPSSGPYVSTRIRYSTTTYPTGENDGLPVTDKAGALGGKDSFDHAGLENDEVHYYAAFVDQGGSYSGGRFVEARPFDPGGGPVRWAYSTGAAALAPPGVGSEAFALSNDRTVHGLVRGDTGGDWPASFLPPTLGGVGQARPPVVPTPLIAPATEVLLVGAQDGRAYAIDAQSGALLWPAPPVLGERVQAAVAGLFSAFGGSFDYLLVGTRNSSSGSAFYALDVATGLPVGAPFDNNGGASGIGVINGMAAVDYLASRVYFASRRRVGGSPNTLWALDISASGLSLAWAIDLGDIDGSPVLRDQRVYVGTNAGVVYSVRASDGADLRSFATNDGAVKGFVFPDRTSNDLFVSTDNRVFGLEDNGAAVVSKWPAVIVPGPSIPVFDAVARRVIVGGGNGRLYQLDVSGPAPVVTSVQLGDGLAVVGAPTLDWAEQAVYVGTEAGIVYGVTLPIP
jgi:hypothetical protein